MSTLSMNSLVAGLKMYYDSAEETKKVIIESAAIAAAADAISSIIPALSIPALIVSCFGAVWVMYVKICQKLNISIKEKTLKLLARAALSNIAANIGGCLLGVIVGMLVPGASIAASAVVTFITVYLAGLVFLNLILKMAKKSKDTISFSDISEYEMKNIVKETKVDREDVVNAKTVFEENKN